MGSLNMPSPQHSVSIKIDEVEQTEKLKSDLVEVVVDTALSLPGAFSLLVTNADLAHDAAFDVGKKVEIRFLPATPGMGNPPPPLISGIITAIEPVFSSDYTALLRVRGYEKCIKLSQGKKIRTYREMTDSGIASKIIGENGLSLEMGSTPVRHPHVIQFNQTDWDFLMIRARQLGFVVCVDGEKLKINKPPTGGPDVELKWPDDILRFEPRLSFLGQVANVTVSGWDGKQKQAISSTVSKADPGPYRNIPDNSRTGASTVSSSVSSKVGETVVDQPLVSMEEAKTMAQAILDRTESGFITAEGESYGNPALKAGRRVKISGVGKKFAGTYLVTQARHEYHSGHYTTCFSINGASPETILSLVSRDTEEENRINGVVTAVVTNSQDPDKAGRVKVKYPWLKDVSGTEVESDWARVAIIGGGKDRGIGFLPEVDDEVLVAFANGDINAPHIVGALWNSKDTAPTGMITSGKTVQRVVRSRSGHVIILDDTDGSENITIKDKTGKNSIVINSKDNSMTIQSEGDLTLQAKGKLVLKSNQDASLVSSQGKTEIKGSTELALSSAVKASLAGAAGAKLDLQASGTKLEGTMVDISGQVKTSLKGNAMVEVQGGIVKIN